MAFDKEQLKERARSLAQRAQSLARERWRDFRANSVYFQLKAALAVGYGVIVIATFVLAPPGAPAYKLRVSSIEWGIAKRTLLELENYKLGTLSGHVVEVHGSVVEFDGKTSTGPWKAKLPRLAEGDAVKIWPDKLMSPDNRPAGDNLAITRVRVFKEDAPHKAVLDAAPEQAPR